MSTSKQCIRPVVQTNSASTLPPRQLTAIIEGVLMLCPIQLFAIVDPKKLFAMIDGLDPFDRGKTRCYVFLFVFPFELHWLRKHYRLVAQTKSAAHYHYSAKYKHCAEQQKAYHQHEYHYCSEGRLARQVAVVDGSKGGRSVGLHVEVGTAVGDAELPV